MKRLYSPIVICLLLLNSCLTNSIENDRINFIRQYINQKGFLKLPYTHSILIPRGKNPYINKNPKDSIITGNLYNKLIGILPDTTNYFSILYIEPGMFAYPIIKIFDKKGTVIDQSNICIGYGDFEKVDYDTCIDKVTIERNFKFIMTYRYYGYDYDNLGKKRGDTIHEQFIETGFINKNGKIKINKSQLLNLAK